MAQRRSNNDTKVLVTAGTTILGGLLLYYLLSGAGSENNAALMPDSVEKHLDRVVDALNNRFGRRWVNFAISVLEATLYGVLPPNIVSLVKTVHQAEQIGLRMGMSGPRKKQQAMRLVQQTGLA